MRLGVVYHPHMCPYYRAIDPMRAMERRGHEVLWPDASGVVFPDQLAKCDVVHFYRNATHPLLKLFSDIARTGTPVTYDMDDNVAAVPKESPNYPGARTLQGERSHAHTVRMARQARVFTTPSEMLAETYRRAGIERIEVIPNYLLADLGRPRSRHDGVVIGWIAGDEHQADVVRLKLPDLFQRLQRKHENLRVECIGVDLRLAERYRHDRWVAFEQLPERIGGFDIGIAPLADIPFNRARSDIKVKEYAGSGVPWLASPVGAYTELGEEQGGRLVGDDDWLEALDRLVSSKRERRRLGRNAKKWAWAETMDSDGADRWERIFREAAGRPRPHRVRLRQK